MPWKVCRWYELISSSIQTAEKWNKWQRPPHCSTMHLCWCQLIQIISLISISPWHWHSQTTPVPPASRHKHRASSGKLDLTFTGSTLIELHRLGKHDELRNANGIKEITLTLGCQTVLSLTSSGKVNPEWYQSSLFGQYIKLHETYHWVRRIRINIPHEGFFFYYYCIICNCVLSNGWISQQPFGRRVKEEQMKMQFGWWDLSW